MDGCATVGKCYRWAPSSCVAVGKAYRLDIPFGYSAVTETRSTWSAYIPRITLSCKARLLIVSYLET